MNRPPKAAASRSARSPAAARSSSTEVEQFLANKKIGPLEGFRSKAGWPFTAEIKLAFDDEINNWKLEFDFGEDSKNEGESGEPIDFSGQESLGPCPKDQGHVFEHGTSYVCEHAVGAHVTCDFKSGKIILQQPIAREQMTKLLATGKTDLLDGFVSNKTRRKFKAYLAYDKKEGKVMFEFEPRAGAAGGGEEGRGGCGGGAGHRRHHGCREERTGEKDRCEKGRREKGRREEGRCEEGEAGVARAEDDDPVVVRAW